MFVLTRALTWVALVLGTMVSLSCFWAGPVISSDGGDRLDNALRHSASQDSVRAMMSREITAQVQRLGSEQFSRTLTDDEIRPFVDAYTHGPTFAGDFTVAAQQVHRWLLTEPSRADKLAGTTSIDFDLTGMLGQVLTNKVLESNAGPVTLVVPDRVTVDLSALTGSDWEAGQFVGVAHGIRTAAWVGLVVLILAAATLIVGRPISGLALVSGGIATGAALLGLAVVALPARIIALGGVSDPISRDALRQVVADLVTRAPDPGILGLTGIVPGVWILAAVAGAVAIGVGTVRRIVPGL